MSDDKVRILRVFTQIRPRVDQFDGKIRLDASETDGDGEPHYSRLRVRSELNKRFFLGAVLEHEDDIQYRWKDESVDLVSPEWRFDKAYLAWSPGGIWEQIIMGNFTAGFASGLTFNDAHRFTPKGIYTDDTTSSSRQRGIGASWQVNRWNGTVFASRMNYPVTLSSDVTGLASRRRIDCVYNEQMIGAEIGVELEKNTEVGFVGYHAWIDKRVDTDFRNLPNRDRWSAVGVYAKTSVEQLDLRGEVSHALEAGWASCLEGKYSTRTASFLASLRHYGTEFDNPHSHGFADSNNSTDKNVDGDIDEVGVFVQIRYRPHPGLRFRAYYDQWQHPSSLQTDNEAYSEVAVYPMNSVELGISGKWSDDEVSIDGDERRSGLLWVRFRPFDFMGVSSSHYANLKLTTVYRRSRLRSSTRVTLDDYVYFKVEWLVAKSVEWEMRWKINDTDATNGDTFPKELYAQLQLWSWHSISGRIRYTQSRFGSSSRTQPNPKHRIFVRVEYEW